MLTDEELKELEEAVERYGSSYWKSDPINGQYWDEEQANDDAHTIATHAIARERAMRQPLTAEICERLGMFKTEQKGVWYVCDHERSAFVGTYGQKLVLKGTRPESIYDPTVGHLFAAATLAGVELDWRKVGE